MIRIGEVVEKYEISHRTLRYWEESGILKSNRNEKGYRFYSDDNRGMGINGTKSRNY